jgi:hypothetical protein
LLHAETAIFSRNPEHQSPVGVLTTLPAISNGLLCPLLPYRPGTKVLDEELREKFTPASWICKNPEAAKMAVYLPRIFAVSVLSLEFPSGAPNPARSGLVSPFGGDPLGSEVSE